MSIQPGLQETLVAVGTVLAGARDPWWIISGAAAALHGAAPICVSDVDVVLSIADAHRLMARIGVGPAPRSHHPRFWSEVFARWTACPLVVEFMANFRLRDADGIWRGVEPATRCAIVVDAVTVYVPDLQDVRALFERLGRPNDRARIRLLDRLG
ncbi:hypothetical protein [Novosphingobium sp. Leaf2]|uniref:hypothetical protein n=1 Tax=Novosphingobium sp. Leaf2 TaxID=1735670 RepID=UPI0012E161DE|nr:hypothetical protein [Novosphingobium sp. Leaf2]